MSVNGAGSSIKERIDHVIASYKVVVFVKSTCPLCLGAKNTIRKLFGRGLSKEEVAFVDVEKDFPGDMETRIVLNYLRMLTSGSTSIPKVFVNGKCIGGIDNTKALHSSGELSKLITGAE